MALAAGCASSSHTDSPPQDRSNDAEARSLRAQVEQAENGRKLAESQLEDSRRELGRKVAELNAARETNAALQSEARLSQDLLIQQKKAFDRKVSELVTKLARSTGATADAVEPVPSEPANVATSVPSSIARARPIDPDAPAAFIDNEPVSRREVMEFLFYKYFHNDIDNYINRVLVTREAKRVGVDISDAEADKTTFETLAMLVKKFGGDEAFAKKLSEEKIDREDLVEILKIDTRATALADKLCLYVRGTKEGQAALEKRARMAYERQFGEKVDAKHFFIKLEPDATDDMIKAAMELAQSLRSRLMTEDWATVATDLKARHRMDANAGRQQVDRSAFAGIADHEGLEAIFFNGIEKEISQPVRWQAGISIVSIERRVAPKATFEEKKPLILEDISKPEVTDEEREQLTKSLRARAKIEKRLELKR